MMLAIRCLLGVICFVVVANLSGCATPATQRVEVDEELVEKEKLKQREIAVHQRLKRDARLADVANDILINGVPLCEETRPYVGVRYATIHDFEEEMREAAKNALGVSKRATLLHVVGGSPAAAADLRRGDVLLAVNDKTISPRADAWSDSATKKLTDALASEVEAGKTVTFKVRRDGEVLDVPMKAGEACGYRVALANNDTINAYADGENIIITTGMIRFAENDDELALVVAHELAHNAMGHIDKKRMNAAGGLVLDILAAAAGVNTQGAFTEAAAQAYSQDFEAEADYVGLYLMVLANRPLEDAPYFWRRMAAENPDATKEHLANTHPTSPERFVAIQETIEEIKSKRHAGKPLRPELKEDANSTQADEEKTASEWDEFPM